MVIEINGNNSIIYDLFVVYLNDLVVIIFLCIWRVTSEVVRQLLMKMTEVCRAGHKRDD